MRLKDEYKTAVIGGFLGKEKFEMLFCDPSLYSIVAKDFPHFFEIEEETFDGMASVKEEGPLITTTKKK